LKKKKSIVYNVLKRTSCKEVSQTVLGLFEGCDFREDNKREVL